MDKVKVGQGRRVIDPDALRLCLEALNAGGCVDQEVIDAVCPEVAEHDQEPSKRHVVSTLDWDNAPDVLIDAVYRLVAGETEVPTEAALRNLHERAALQYLHERLVGLGLSHDARHLLREAGRQKVPTEPMPDAVHYAALRYLMDNKGRPTREQIAEGLPGFGRHLVRGAISDLHKWGWVHAPWQSRKGVGLLIAGRKALLDAGLCDSAVKPGTPGPLPPTVVTEWTQRVELERPGDPC